MGARGREFDETWRLEFWRGGRFGGCRAGLDETGQTSSEDPRIGLLATLRAGRPPTPDFRPACRDPLIGRSKPPEADPSRTDLIFGRPLGNARKDHRRCQFGCIDGVLDGAVGM